MRYEVKLQSVYHPYMDGPMGVLDCDWLVRCDQVLLASSVSRHDELPSVRKVGFCVYVLCVIRQLCGTC